MKFKHGQLSHSWIAPTCDQCVWWSIPRFFITFTLLPTGLLWTWICNCHFYILQHFNQMFLLHLLLKKWHSVLDGNGVKYLSSIVHHLVVVILLLQLQQANLTNYSTCKHETFHSAVVINNRKTKQHNTTRSRQLFFKEMLHMWFEPSNVHLLGIVLTNWAIKAAQLAGLESHIQYKLTKGRHIHTYTCTYTHETLDQQLWNHDCAAYNGFQEWNV